MKQILIFLFGSFWFVYCAILGFKIRKAYLFLQETNRIIDDEHAKSKDYIRKIEGIEKTFVSTNLPIIDHTLASHVLSGEVSHLKDSISTSANIGKNKNL